MKKRLFAALLATAMVASFASCGSSTADTSSEETTEETTTEEEATEEASGEAVEVELWHYFENEADALNIMCDEYNELQSDIHITPTYVARDDLMNNYTIGAVSGELPDIGMVDSPDMESYISLGVFADITDQLEEWGELDNFYTGPLASCTDAEGRIYGLPNNSNCLCLAANQDMLDAAGIEEMPSTWDELRADIEATADPDNEVYGLAMSCVSTEEGTFQLMPWLYSNGGSVDDLTSEGSQGAFQYLYDLINDGYMDVQVINWGQGDAYNAWVAGKSVFLESGTWQLSTIDADIEASATPFKYSYGLMPAGESGHSASTIGGENFGVCTGSANQEACADFLMYMESAENNAEWCGIAGKCVVRADAEDLNPMNENEYFQIFSEEMKYAVARGPHSQWTTISESIQDAMGEIFSGEATVADGTAKAMETIQPIVDEEPLPAQDTTVSGNS